MNKKKLILIAKMLKSYKNKKSDKNGLFNCEQMGSKATATSVKLRTILF